MVTESFCEGHVAEDYPKGEWAVQEIDVCVCVHACVCVCIC